ncbi:MAG: DUF6070 family protein [Coprobacillus sp.]
MLRIKEKSMNRLKYVVVVIFIFVILICVYSFNNTKIRTNNSDQTVIIPDYEVLKIEKDLERLDPYITLVRKDDMSGYSKGQGVPSLSKQGVKEIYDYLKEQNVTVNDEQGYFDLQNSEIFKEFIELYKQGKDSRFTHYIILLTGELIRKDFINEDNHTYVITSSLLFKNNQFTIEDIYGKEIKNLTYDEYGYFYYECVLVKDGVMRGEQQYFSMKIDPIKDELRTYNRLYIQPISYYCNNMFTTSWKENEISKLSFNDIIEYLYVLDTDKPFPSNDFEQCNVSYVRRVESVYFENLVQKYFDLSVKEIKNNNFYDKETDSYPYVELCCRASHWKLPEIFSEVIDVKDSKNLIILTIRVMGYEEGYPLAFEHKVTIEKKKNSFKYISNEIIESSYNKIPEYTSGITEEILSDYKDK